MKLYREETNIMTDISIDRFCLEFFFSSYCFDYKSLESIVFCVEPRNTPDSQSNLWAKRTKQEALYYLIKKYNEVTVAWCGHRNRQWIRIDTHKCIYAASWSLSKVLRVWTAKAIVWVVFSVNGVWESQITHTADVTRPVFLTMYKHQFKIY